MDSNLDTRVFILGFHQNCDWENTDGEAAQTLSYFVAQNIWLSSCEIGVLGLICHSVWIDPIKFAGQAWHVLARLIHFRSPEDTWSHGSKS